MENIDKMELLSNSEKDPTHRKVDVLIIGQGISGTSLSYLLSNKNISFLVIDDKRPNAPSRVAAGIINPVTGRRFVKTWMIEELLPFVLEFYKELGRELNTNAISEKMIIDFFPSPQMKLAFEERLKEGESFLKKPVDDKFFIDRFNYSFGYGRITPSYTVHLENILPAWRSRLIKQTQLIEEEFDISQLQFDDKSVQYRNITTQKIIFCDGLQSAKNHFFDKLPFASNKGEMLIVEIPGLSKEFLYKKGMTLAPLLSPDIFWFGSNYLWEYQDERPSPVFYKQAEQVLRSWIKLPHKILEQKVSLRPATIERKPFVGFHPKHPTIGILNGMGTKGCSLSPYFAKQLVDHIKNRTPILPEADISRFQKILST